MGRAEVLSDGLPRDLREIIVLEIEEGALLSFTNVLIELSLDLTDGGILQMMADTA